MGSGDHPGRFRRARAERDGSGRCSMGSRRSCAACIGECGGGGGGTTVSRARAELGMAGACCPRVQGEPYPFYRRRQREESERGRASWGRATVMVWARGQGTATAVAWRGRSWRPSRGSGTRASRPCSQRGRQGGKPWALEGGLVGGAATRPGQVASPVYGPAICRVQGGERLKKLSVAVL